MVIHDESDLPSEVPVIKKPLFETKSYLIPYVHVQNGNKMNVNDGSTIRHRKNMRKLTESQQAEQVRTTRSKAKKRDLDLESYDTTRSSNTISVEDLEELKSVYKKCKAVIKKIELKYGHLLNLSEPILCKNSRVINSDNEETECQCTMNKKIVFDDEGKQIIVDSEPSDHICPKKQKLTQTIKSDNDVQVEYHDQAMKLPDNLYELKSILQDPELDITYRNQVIEKHRRIRQEHYYEMKFNKPSIVEKMKLDADDIIDFKGTNLSSLPGYIY